MSETLKASLLARFGINATQDDIDYLRGALTAYGLRCAQQAFDAIESAKRCRFEPLINAIEEVSGRTFRAIRNPKQRNNSVWKCIFIEICLQNRETHSEIARRIGLSRAQVSWYMTEYKRPSDYPIFLTMVRMKLKEMVTINN